MYFTHVWCRDTGREAKLIEAQLSLLLNVGLLTRHSAAQDRFLFAMPNAGPLVRAIIAGRKVTPRLFMPAMLTMPGRAMQEISEIQHDCLAMMLLVLLPRLPQSMMLPVGNRMHSCDAPPSDNRAGDSGYLIEKEASRDVCEGAGEEEATRLSAGNAVPHPGPPGVWPAAEEQYHQWPLTAGRQEALVQTVDVLALRIYHS